MEENEKKKFKVYKMGCGKVSSEVCKLHTSA